MPEANANLIGRVRKYHSNFYYVEAEGVLYECMLRGLLKKEGIEVLVGDQVRLDSVQPANRTARIIEVLLPRKSVISRPRMANADQAIVVYSLHAPEFDYHQADRYLTHIKLAGLKPILCISKADLSNSEAERLAISDIYEPLGFQVLFTSVHQPEGLEALYQEVRSKVTVLAGPSGSGKSSLLNALNPDLKLRVGEVSEKIGRGQHTTRHVELLAPDPADPSTLIADTPGFSNLKFNTVLPTDLAAIYPDFEPWRDQCAFSDCLHVDEAGCAVLGNREKLASSRYESYLNMMAEAREYKHESSKTSQKDEFGYKRIDRKGREIKILRLREKDRDVSRRRVRQQFSQVDTDEEVPFSGSNFESDDFPI
jgi:ribosome biogenesis GTPase